MNSSRDASQQLAVQLEMLASQLRRRALTPGQASGSLDKLLNTLGVGPSTTELIASERTGSTSMVDDLLDVVTSSPPPPRVALDVSEPLMEIEAPSADTSEHTAAELLGLQTQNLASPGGRDLSQPDPPSIDVDPSSSTHATNPAPLERLPILAASRYEVRDMLGTGGQGDVREVHDKVLQRTVALKALREDLIHQPHVKRAFVREARVLAQLSHPSIVPVYDLGELANTAPAYTMKLIRGRSLRDVLHAIRRNESWTKEYPRRRLIEILLQVAHTVGYAHHLGVVHRDLKPGNIMVGDYGEVLVVDWGIARVYHDPEEEKNPTLEALSSARFPQDDVTAQGIIKGTPAYMAPEQARGDNANVGPWTDVHALGLILYEILAGEPARESGMAEEVVLKAQVPITRSPERRRLEDKVACDPIPEELDQLTMKALADPYGVRYPDGESFAKALRGYLDGQKRREQAELRATEAELKVAGSIELEEELSALRTRLNELRSRISPWSSPDQKRPLWELENRISAIEHLREESINQAVLYYSQALDGDPDNPRARRGLADLFYQRLVQAEQLGRMRDARQLEANLKRLNDGHLTEKLSGYGSLLLSSASEPVEAWLYPYEVVDNILKPGEGRSLGRTPIKVEQLAMGRYLLVLHPKHGREVYYPIWIRRQTRWVGRVRVFPDLEDRFIQIPGGPCILGGDRLANSAISREERVVDDFAIAAYPVSCKEYLLFLNSLPLTQALRHAPRASGIYGGRIWWPVEGGRLVIPQTDEAGGRWDPRFAVRSISRTDAEAYARWLSRQDGNPYRLPTEAEWEKAARGTDGRAFPWGDVFDASFCKMRDSRPGRAEPEPVGAFPTDRSPYGVMDMAGNISEWVSDSFDRYHKLGNLKGGFWRGGDGACRLAGRFASDPDEPAPFAGFRLAMDLIG